MVGTASQAHVPPLCWGPQNRPMATLPETGWLAAESDRERRWLGFADTTTRPTGDKGSNTKRDTWVEHKWTATESFALPPQETGSSSSVPRHKPWWEVVIGLPPRSSRVVWILLGLIVVGS